MLYRDSNQIVFELDYNTVVMSTFGKWLLAKRKGLRLLQSDVARAAGVSVSYISTLERAQPHTITGGDITPEREKVAAIARAVGGDPDEALLMFGYAPDSRQNDYYDGGEGIRIIYSPSSGWTAAEKELIADQLKTIVAGIKARKKEQTVSVRRVAPEKITLLTPKKKEKKTA